MSDPSYGGPAGSSGGSRPAPPEFAVPGAVTGIVRDHQQQNVLHRGSSDSTTVSSHTVHDFRLDPESGSGPVAVRIDGYTLTGAFREGDRVTVVGAMKKGTLHARSMFNHETGAVIEEPHRAARVGCGVVFGLFFLLVLAGIVFAAWQMFSQPPPGFP